VVYHEIREREGSKARAILKGSLKRLQTDHVDLFHIHCLTDAADLARIEAKDGVLDILLKAKAKVSSATSASLHTATPKACVPPSIGTPLTALKWRSTPRWPA
jgi:predicted aldo/keto reductase-like oxidoreductase